MMMLHIQSHQGGWARSLTTPAAHFNKSQSPAQRLKRISERQYKQGVVPL